MIDVIHHCGNCLNGPSGFDNGDFLDRISDTELPLDDEQGWYGGFQWLRRTLTWDQGKELAMHQRISEQTGARVFFCDAHSPWQRDPNENMNGLLRDYFPSGSDLRQITPQELARVAEEINNRPRKTLGWACPADLLAGETVADSA